VKGIVAKKCLRPLGSGNRDGLLWWQIGLGKMKRRVEETMWKEDQILSFQRRGGLYAQRQRGFGTIR